MALVNKSATINWREGDFVKNEGTDQEEFIPARNEMGDRLIIVDTAEGTFSMYIRPDTDEAAAVFAAGFVRDFGHPAQ